jgi:beta-mannosidase
LPPKDLNLPKTFVISEIKNDAGSYLLRLSSAKLVKNLYLSLQDGDGFFSDNYFDILPGQEVTIRFTPTREMDLQTFTRNLKMMKLDDI